jgi:hypothetical protein
LVVREYLNRAGDMNITACGTSAQISGDYVSHGMKFIERP